jgi:hypothetical protein
MNPSVIRTKTLAALLRQKGNPDMRLLQASPTIWKQAIRQAMEWRCGGIAWNLREDCSEAVAQANHLGFPSEGWLQVARDPQAAADHPDWMHCPQHHEWLRRYPDFPGEHPALVAPYIGLNTRPAFEYALETAADLIRSNAWASRVWLADVQGPPMGCGCGNPSCRSWDNAPGEKVAESPYDQPEILFPLEFYTTLAARLRESGHIPSLVPVLCPECERGVTIDGVHDPDGPHGTDLCQGIPCVRPCALDYGPRLLEAFRHKRILSGVLLMTVALGKNHSIYGRPRAWARRAHRHYGADLIPCVEAEDAENFESALILTDAPQTCWPQEPPPGYTPALPPHKCGSCPPEP